MIFARARKRVRWPDLLMESGERPPSGHPNVDVGWWCRVGPAASRPALDPPLTARPFLTVVRLGDSRGSGTASSKDRPS